MLALAVAALVGSAGSAWAIGAAVVARRDSFLRSKRGIALLVLLGLSLITLPPQLPSLGAGVGSMTGAAGGMLPDLGWPAGISGGAYIALWIATSLGALLLGVRIWKAGTADWRPGASVYDSSAASRISGLLPLADSLPAVLDVLGRSDLRERDLARIADAVRDAGRRLADALPPSDGALYTLVAAKLPAAAAGAITGYLLEGAGRRARH